MEDFNHSNRNKLFEPPVPKARPSIRNLNNYKIGINKENMHKTEIHSNKYYTNSMEEISDDENYSDSDDDDVDNQYGHSYEVDDLSESILQDSFCSAYNSPFTNTSRSVNTTNTSLSYRQPQNKNEKEVSTLNLILLISAIIAAIFSICVICTMYDQERIPKIEEHNLFNADKVDEVLNKLMEKVQLQFHNQKPSIWNDILSGMYDVVLYPEKPLIIILFGNDIDPLNCLAQLLGQIGGIVLGSNDYLTLIAKDFPNNIGETIQNLKLQILQKRAVVIQDLLSINKEAIKAFHNFCDREKPLIGRAMYVITVIVDGYKPSQKEMEFIEKQMMTKLSNKIDKDVLDPLITRLTDGVVVPVLPESSINYNKCSLTALHKQ